ncbi:transketolase [Youngiibacter multivorans]|uniref:Transketolase n=1 Tax=Youngiibacter multivorans TaxID=937251 RepID=A0ABS4G342_9CLOT|nr:transketolase [Youngiibacter multivorans]MBP1918936.1 transketolase [Youngiibacter multivorans]
MYSEKLVADLEDKARKLRKNVIVSMGVGFAGHIGGSFSSADMVAALYFHKLRHDPEDKKMTDRDRFLLSKGHVAILQYSALAEAGYFPIEDLVNTKRIDSYLQGHPDVLKTPGIEAGTGSLGQGLSIGLGMAMGLKMDGLDSKVYVLMGDGEQQEGQIWEAAMAATVYNTDNLVGIVDCNKLQATGPICERFDAGDIKNKWESFGWNTIEINGHDMKEILWALDETDKKNGKPTVIIMNTVKGKGLSFAENVVSYHNGMLSKENYDKAMAELS